MTPSWFLPIFPILLAGTVASLFAGNQPTNIAVPMIVVGLSCLGLGFTVSVLLFAIYFARMMLYGLPLTELRPALFIALGPPSFLVITLLNLGQAALLHDDFFSPSTVSPAAVFNVGCVFVSVFVWTFALWIFLIALCGTVAALGQLSYRMGFWAMIFPNAAFTVATSTLATTLNWGSLKGVATAMSVLLILTWLGVLGGLIFALFTNRVLMPYKDDDKPENGYVGEFAPGGQSDTAARHEQQQQQQREQRQQSGSQLHTTQQREPQLDHSVPSAQSSNDSRAAATAEELGVVVDVQAVSRRPIPFDYTSQQYEL